MCRSAVEVVVVLLDVLTVVASLLVRPNIRSLRIGSLPFHSARAKQSIWWVIAYSSQTILSPAIGSGTCLIVSEIVPGIERLRIEHMQTCSNTGFPNAELDNVLEALKTENKLA
jgi:hypothetical protein